MDKVGQHGRTDHVLWILEVPIGKKRVYTIFGIVKVGSISTEFSDYGTTFMILPLVAPTWREYSIRQVVNKSMVPTSLVTSLYKPGKPRRRAWKI